MKYHLQDRRNVETPRKVEVRVRAAKQQRVELTAGSRDFVATVTTFLFGDDPLGINAASNTDENIRGDRSGFREPAGPPPEGSTR
ncbi:hypothetical protein IEZ26_15865 [Nocardioides cavernae]|uniref:Uncharacterized protein n=1 Tax=Nocardioides cavernae TaxID=1921566 RepID=A0ABR8NEI2_9ACTN|nr:hypothetical protein [Nocardioides cavernae]MBD3926101.1 hypothetical protein [Nocardioides cavernae]MBM7513690.1 hypothetical protein [Nocardioides cavernae]